MTLEVRQLVIRSELDGGGSAAKSKHKEKEKEEKDNGEESCCSEDKAASGDHADRRARERELREMLERLGER